MLPIHRLASPTCRAGLVLCFVAACKIDGHFYPFDAAPDGSHDIPDIVVNHQPAELVLGQPDFDTSNSSGPSAQHLRAPTGLSESENGSLWVYDQGNYRALQWTSMPQVDFAPSSRVLGHPNFTTVTAEPPNSSSLSNYQGGISARAGKVILADGARNRVLIWNQNPIVNGQDANIVLGQPTFTATTPGSSASNLNLPNAVWTDGTRLVVSDGGNNRVLVWQTFPTTNQQPADLVLGQPGFGQASIPDPPTASSMYWPHAVYFDGTRLYVADMNNARVLIWNSFPMSNGQAADLVVGQTDFTGRRQGLEANRLGKPTGLAVAGSNLFVVDQSNNRVLVFSPIPTASGASASHVLGQPDFLTNSSSTSQISFSVPTGVAAQGAKLYVSDTFNSRVLRFTLILE
jgi:hypothetical protein